ncbi:hypothetical protein TWF679_000968 [Orbilia oligospora]|uniref:Peptidase A1 domain-containing protein n=1 Tax=Orbilia oligospora TaxID=2813651 RepID=A0A8H8VHQ5_ORBOL|nr:hypothetical protein TWF679_000968 [Orbilia oligospora]
MISNINTFSCFALSSLVLAHFGEAVAIPRFGKIDGKVRRDISEVVRRSSIAPRQVASARGLVQPIWLSDDGLRYYTNVSFGTPPQPLTLALSLDGTTWAPTLPAGVSADSYCADTKNEVSCSYATISGFYTIPGSVTYSPRGDYQELEVDSQDTVNGIQATEHIQLGSSILANVGIAVADSWTSAPLLSLSSLPTPEGPGQQLLPVLQQAGLINTLTYSLAFTSVDRRGNINYDSGELSFGGIDETQFSGKLSSFESGNDTDAGVLPVSNIYWIDGKGRNVSIVDEDSDAGRLGVGQVSLTPYLWIPDAMFEIIVSLFSDVEKSEGSEGYTRNCTASIEELDVKSLQLSIDGTFITIPTNLLFFPAIGRKDLCNLAVRPISDYPATTAPADYILGFPFLRSAYTVFDHTHRLTHLAPRRVAFSSTSSLTPVGEGNATVSGTGASLRTTFQAATTTLSVPLQQLSETPSTTTATTTSASATPTETKLVYYYEPPKSKPNIGAIVGGVVGAVVFLAVVIVFYPLLKAANDSRKRQSKRESRRRERSRTSSANDLSPVDSNQNGEENENDEDGDEKEDVDAITTAIAIANSKRDMPVSEDGNRNSIAGARDSVTVNITEIDEASSRGGRKSSDAKSMNTFGESEKS